MKRLILLAATAGLALWSWTTPAHAFNFSGCGVFEAIGFHQLVFESSAHFTDLKGDALVADPVNGFIKTGQNNTFGALFAHKINMQTGSKANFCFADIIEGNAAGCLVTGPFVVPAACSAQPWPPGIVTPSVPSPCLPGTDVVITGTQSLAPGCFKSIKVAQDGDLTLTAGGFYFTKGEFRIGNRASVQSSVAGTRATTVSGSQTITGTDVDLKDLFLFQLATSPPMHIFNNATLDNVIALAPNGVLHLHNKSTLKGGSAIAGFSLDVEPVISLASDTPPILCECPAGTVFKLQSCTSVSCDAARECVVP